MEEASSKFPQKKIYHSSRVLCSTIMPIQAPLLVTSAHNNSLTHFSKTKHHLSKSSHHSPLPHA